MPGTAASRTAAGSSSRAPRSPATRDRGPRRSEYADPISVVVLPVTLGLSQQREDSRPAPAGRARSSHSPGRGVPAPGPGRARWPRSGRGRRCAGEASRWVQAVKASPPTSISTTPRSASIARRAGRIRAARQARSRGLACRLTPTPDAQQPLLGGVWGSCSSSRLSASVIASCAKPSGRGIERLDVDSDPALPGPPIAANAADLTVRMRERDDRYLGRALQPGDDTQRGPWSSGRISISAGSGSRPSVSRSNLGDALLGRGARAQPLELPALGYHQRREQLALAAAQHPARPDRLPQAAIGRKPRVHAPAGDVPLAIGSKRRAPRPRQRGQLGGAGQRRKTLWHGEALVLPTAAGASSSDRPSRARRCWRTRAVRPRAGSRHCR